MGLKDKVFSLADAHLDFVKKAFSDGGIPSSSRLLTALHSFVACAALLYIVIRSPLHTVDGAVAAGLGGFSTAHYFVNRTTSAYQNKKTDPIPPAPSQV